MTIEDRIARARASSYELRLQFRQARREKSQLRARFMEQLYEWRVAAMKHEILIGEIRSNSLRAESLGLTDRRADDERCCGLPIQ